MAVPPPAGRRGPRHVPSPESPPGSTGVARAAQPLPQPRPAIERPPEVPPALARRVRRGHRRHPRPGGTAGTGRAPTRPITDRGSPQRPDAAGSLGGQISPLRAVVTVNDGNPVSVTRRAQRRRSQRGRYHTDRHPGAGATGAYQHTHRKSGCRRPHRQPPGAVSWVAAVAGPPSRQRLPPQRIWHLAPLQSLRKALVNWARPWMGSLASTSAGACGRGAGAPPCCGWVRSPC